MASGADCLFEGLHLIRQPGLRRYVAMPLLINIVLLSAMAAYGISRYDAWTGALTSYLPDWLSLLSWLVGLLAAALVVVMVLYLFTIVANIVAAPFNAVLSVKVEERLTGRAPMSNAGLHVVVTRSIGREIVKVLYYLPRLLGLLVIAVIPGLNAVAPVLWVLLGAWMMAVEYCDYAADNNEVSFKELRRRLGQSRLDALLFGVMVYVVLAIPFLNLVLVPAAVAGGTVFWVRRLGEVR